MTVLTDDALAALDAVVAKATPREWTEAPYSSICGAPIVAAPRGRPVASVTYFDLGPAFVNHDAESKANGEAIVALHNAYPALRAIIDVERARADVFATEIEALRAQVAHLREGVDWIGSDKRLSLTHYAPMYGDDCDQSEEWRVERETGPINDRGWTILGRGQSPIEAIQNATRAALGEKP
jgi:hypothetical protein